MRIFIFKSELGGGLCAFAADSDTRILPPRHGPWHAVGVVRADANPPYNLKRDVIEQAIANHGYQLFRVKKDSGTSLQEAV
ncbi:MAG TPA: hypothetical protein VJ809_02535 [Pirellulales bacterium]|nr:hypothetical protein [Pirellulales bacterium]